MIVRDKVEDRRGTTRSTSPFGGPKRSRCDIINTDADCNSHESERVAYQYGTQSRVEREYARHRRLVFASPDMRTTRESSRTGRDVQRGRAAKVGWQRKGQTARFTLILVAYRRTLGADLACVAGRLRMHGKTERSEHSGDGQFVRCVCDNLGCVSPRDPCDWAARPEAGLHWPQETN